MRERLYVVNCSLWMAELKKKRMKQQQTSRRLAFLIPAITLLVLVIDQVLKVWVKTNMVRGERIHITDWFYILFTENPGMAFGMEIFDKLFLTAFRIVAVVLIIWYIVRLCRNTIRRVPTGYLVCLALILAGAVGNIIDCVLYGQIFSESTYTEIARFVPFGEGYAPLGYGKVVDMFYFPLIEANFPMWMPFVGGEHFIFFSPIFNFADASISCGIIALLLFYSKYLQPEQKEDEDENHQPETPAQA